VKILRLIIAASAALTIAGCGSAPQRHDFSNSRAVTQSYDQTWEDIVSYFAARNIQVKNIAKDSGVIYAETAQVDAEFADCGKPGFPWTPISTEGRFNVFVKRGEQKQVVSVNAQFIQLQQSAMANPPSTRTESCVSTGELERTILQSLTTQ
jgi:hypothetical protein